MPLPNKRLQTCLQDTLVCFGHVAKTKRLQPTLCGPHGKKHFNFFADRGLPEMEDQLDLQLFVQWLLQIHQAAAGRELMQFASHLPPVGQANERED